MITTKLWRFLILRPLNPTLAAHVHHIMPRNFVVTLWTAIEPLAVTVCLMLAPFCCIGVLFVEPNAIVLGLIVCLAGANLVWGTRCASEFASVISDYRSRGILEYLSTTPPGGIGHTIAIAATIIHHNNRFDRFRDVYTTASLFLVALGSLYGLVIFVSTASQYDVVGLSALRGVFVTLTLFFSPHVPVPLTVTATLCGSVAGLLKVRRQESGLFAVVLYLIVLALCFVMSIAVFGLATNAIDRTIDVKATVRFVAEAIAVAMTAIIFAASVQLANTLLWRAVCAQLDIAPDIDALTEQPL
jgi:hypothetical protein